MSAPAPAPIKPPDTARSRRVSPQPANARITKVRATARFILRLRTFEWDRPGGLPQRNGWRGALVPSGNPLIYDDFAVIPCNGYESRALMAPVVGRAHP